MFPGARVEQGAVGAARDVVRGRVTLSVAPPRQVTVHLRSFDVHDPSAEVAPVDGAGAAGDEGIAEDNRGAAPKAGEFLGDVGAGGVKALAFAAAGAAGARTADAELRVTMQPGDNFRLVASADADFLAGLHNDDDALNLGQTVAERNANKQRIVHTGVAAGGGNPADWEIREPDQHTSPTLTVWRFMHVEVDSMATPTDNQVTTSIASITADANGMWARRIHTADHLQPQMDVTGAGLFLEPDQSANLSSNPAGNGRFENGRVTVGLPIGGVSTIDLDGNGDTFIQRDAGIAIPFVADDQADDVIEGYVTALVGRTFTVRITSGATADWNGFVGGTFAVAGVGMEIEAADGTARTFTVQALTQIPIVVHDDDMDSVLPAAVDTSNLQASDALEHNRFAQAYIRPVYDGGGDVANNRNDVPAVANTTASDVFRWDSWANNSAKFWVQYFLAAFQPASINGPNSALFDGDPDGESDNWLVWAVADPPGYDRLDSGGVLFYLETMRDGGLDSAWRARVPVHEAGHNFGLDDHQAGFTPASAGIMWHNTNGLATDHYFFSDTDLHIIRGTSAPYS